MKFIIRLVIVLIGWCSFVPGRHFPQTSANSNVICRNKSLPISQTSAFVGKLGSELLIVGGTRANKSEFPWLVHFKVDKTFCAGALIEMDLVLTASHCFIEESKRLMLKQITVVAGDHRMDIDDKTEERLPSAWIKVHEDYSNYVHDIALIKLIRSFKETNAVKKINIPYNAVQASSGSKATVAGWGFTENVNEVSKILYKVEVPIATDEDCRKVASNLTYQFCAGDTGKDACDGDSGGPLICDKNPGVVCGIVSCGKGCGEAGFPGVYTNVSEYLTWISENRIQGGDSSSNKLCANNAGQLFILLLILSI